MTTNAASTYLENKLLDHVLGVAPYTAPTTVYLALFNNTSTQMTVNLEANVITDEIGAADYARKAVAFSAAVDGSTSNPTEILFDEAISNWGTVDGVAIMDAETDGNVLFWGIPSSIKTIEIGDIYKIKVSNLTVNMS